MQPRVRSREDDIALARAVSEGDSEKIEFFCSEFANDIARYARRFSGKLPAEELEDISQIVLTTAVLNIETYRGESSLKTWILRISHYKMIDATRRQDAAPERAFAEMPEGWEPAWPEQPETIAISNDEKALVNDALAKLPAEERHVVTLRYMDELDTMEISKVINKSHRVTQKLLTQARARLLTLLDFDKNV